MAAMAPEGVAVYATRILFEPTLQGLRDMKDHVERAAAELSSEGICDRIAFCCTVGSMIGGADYDEELIRMMEETSGTPALTATTAVKAALKSLNVKRIAMATPYTRQINELERNLMESMGYEVTDIAGYHDALEPDALRNDMIGRLEPEAAYTLGRNVDSARNEAIFISCTNFRAIEIIHRLEQDTGKPVITSNQATLWHCLRSQGIRDSLDRVGRLFKES
jgi:maleate cis-trans isomerase